MRHAQYRIVFSTGSRVIIRDVGPWDQYATVTNDAEHIVADLVARGRLSKEQQLLYLDSEGVLDELVHDGDMFLGFLAGPSDDDDLIAMIKALDL